MKTSVSALLHQENDWLRELEFYKEDMYILSSRMDEVNKKNTSQETLARADQLLNKLYILRQRLDELKHDINAHSEKVAAIAKDKPTHIHERALPENDLFFNKVKSLIQDIADIRFEFNSFLAKVF